MTHIEITDNSFSTIGHADSKYVCGMISAITQLGAAGIRVLTGDEHIKTTINNGLFCCELQDDAPADTRAMFRLVLSELCSMSQIYPKNTVLVDKRTARPEESQNWMMKRHY